MVGAPSLSTRLSAVWHIGPLNLICLWWSTYCNIIGLRPENKMPVESLRDAKCAVFGPLADDNSRTRELK